MRLFTAACLFGLLVATLGCITDNWNRSLFRKAKAADLLEDVVKEEKKENWLQRTIGKGQASDERAREIEQRLGYSSELGYDR